MNCFYVFCISDFSVNAKYSILTLLLKTYFLKVDLKTDRHINNLEAQDRLDLIVVFALLIVYKNEVHRAL